MSQIEKNAVIDCDSLQDTKGNLQRSEDWDNL